MMMAGPMEGTAPPNRGVFISPPSSKPVTNRLLPTSRHTKSPATTQVTKKHKAVPPPTKPFTSKGTSGPPSSTQPSWDDRHHLLSTATSGPPPPPRRPKATGCQVASSNNTSIPSPRTTALLSKKSPTQHQKKPQEPHPPHHLHHHHRHHYHPQHDKYLARSPRDHQPCSPSPPSAPLPPHNRLLLLTGSLPGVRTSKSAPQYRCPPPSPPPPPLVKPHYLEKLGGGGGGPPPPCRLHIPSSPRHEDRSMRGVEMPHHHHHMEVDKEGEGDRWGEDWEYRSEASMDADTSPGQIDEGVGPSQGEGQLSGGDMSPLLLDIAKIDAEHDLHEANRTMRISESGSINIGGFEIRRTGLYSFTTNQDKPEQDKEPQGPSSDSDGIRNRVMENVQESIAPLAMLGRGASGVVWKAIHVPTMKVVAVKTIPVFEEGRRHQMVRELRALYDNLIPLSPANEDEERRGGCPQLVYFYDAFVSPTEGTISIVQEYMNGGSLQDIVDCGGCDDERVLASMSAQVLKGLAFLHERRQIHRDIKPANLLINHLGEVKISDFGLVRNLDSSISQAETFVGTFTFMSPERICGEEYSFPADVWALGLTIVTCALGRFPYDDSGGYWGLVSALKDRDPPELPPEFSPAFRDFVCLCLAKDPSLRPPAKALLQHPFVKDYQQFTPPKPPAAWQEGNRWSESAEIELDDIIEVIKVYYRNMWARQDQMGVAPSVPNFHVAAIKSLARQLGMSMELVRRQFEQMVREMILDIIQDQ